MNATLFDRLWRDHTVHDFGDGRALLHIDRHFLHDLNGGIVLADMRRRGWRIRNPELTIATPDHSVPTTPSRSDRTAAAPDQMAGRLHTEAHIAGVRAFGLNEYGQGIVHVIGPELGLTLPGLSVVCGDSHTCTQGALGALAFGIGRTEVLHVLATQTVYQSKPRQMRLRLEGSPQPGVSPKDMILHTIGQIGAAGASGYAVEFAGSAIAAMPMEGRLTICNLAIELGAKWGLIAPDEITFAYLAGRPFAPRGARWEQALAEWRGLRSDPLAHFDRDITIDVSSVAPQITWGTSPQHVIGIDGAVPDPNALPEPKREEARRALAYMGLTPGQKMSGVPIDWVFIGSCTNGRLDDLRAAASVARGRHVAPGLHAWVVPGSQAVKRAAEAEGLDKVFSEAGFEWRDPGCSMCLAANGETMPPEARSVSTTNRNFEGRQGPRARTHLASPATAAAAAVTGRITDLRRMGM